MSCPQLEYAHLASNCELMQTSNGSANLTKSNCINGGMALTEFSHAVNHIFTQKS